MVTTRFLVFYFKKRVGGNLSPIVEPEAPPPSSTSIAPGPMCSRGKNSQLTFPSAGNDLIGSLSPHQTFPEYFPEKFPAIFGTFSQTFLHRFSPAHLLYSSSPHHLLISDFLFSISKHLSFSLFHIFSQINTSCTQSYFLFAFNILVFWKNVQKN